MLNQKNIFITIAISALLAFLMAGCGDDASTAAPVPTPTAGTVTSIISGVVYDLEGKALDGAKVVLTPLISTSENYGDPQEYITKDGGQYSFTVRYGGNYLIEAREEETLIDSKQFTVTLGENSLLILGVPEDSADLKLYVWQDAEKTIPVNDFIVELDMTNVKSGDNVIVSSQGKEGLAEFENLPAGNYHITIFYEDIVEEENIELSVGDNTENIILYRWHIKIIDGTTRLQSVYFTDKLNGWSVGRTLGDTGYIGAVIKTTDGGDNWEIGQTISNTNFLISVYFTDKLNGWAVGEKYEDPEHKGVVIRTTDGGVTWSEPMFIDETQYLNSVYFTDKLNGCAVGLRDDGTGVIVKTTDGGNSWSEPIAGGKEGPLSSVYFIDSRTGWAVGAKAIMKTTDGGNSWNIIYDNHFLSVYFTDSRTGWVVGPLNIKKTMDGGNTWQLYPRSYGELQYLSVNFSDSMNGWIVGYSTAGAFATKTEDEGINWSDPMFIDGVDFLYSVSSIDLNTAWSSGQVQTGSSAEELKGIILKYAPLVP